MPSFRPRPFVLIILDGWGHREDTEHNAIAAAKKPVWDHLMQHYPHTFISGSGKCVGLPHNQMGNSEVGHLNIGAGRIVSQDFTRIDHAIQNEEFFRNPILVDALETAKLNHQAVHVMGLLSPGGVHSHERHIQALIKLAAQLKIPKLYIHAFLDGRDTPPRSALASIQELETLCKKLHCGEIVSLVGRYYAMDRDKRWERIQKAYELITEGKANYQANTAEEGLLAAYARFEDDEFVKATSIHEAHSSPHTVKDGDIFIFMNFRSDRAREITYAFTDENFSGFERKAKPKLGQFLCLSRYDDQFNLPIIFPPQPLDNILAEYLSSLDLKQLRIAETEKYAHVTFFFNGGIEKPYPHEERILIPSPLVATYDLKPEMSAYEVTKELVKQIDSKKYDVIICNFANPDMVGHTGKFEPTVKAIEVIDQCIGEIMSTTQKVGGEILITADHGNAEQMFDEISNQPHTAHTSDPVPFIYVGRKADIVEKDGKLSDIAPTLLYLMDLPIPKEMTGKPLVKLLRG